MAPRRRRVLAHLPAAMKLRARIRAHAELWIGDLAWSFPTWCVRRRPFDWAEDEADVPVDAEDRWHRGDRQQFDLYLRPAGAVVRR